MKEKREAFVSPIRMAVVMVDCQIQRLRLFLAKYDLGCLKVANLLDHLIDMRVRLPPAASSYRS